MQTLNYTDLRISIREKGVFACFHPDAGDLFNVCSDLKRVCWTLYDPKKRLEKNVSTAPELVPSWGHVV